MDPLLIIMPIEFIVLIGIGALLYRSGVKQRRFHTAAFGAALAVTSVFEGIVLSSIGYDILGAPIMGPVLTLLGTIPLTACILLLSFFFRKKLRAAGFELSWEAKVVTGFVIAMFIAVAVTKHFEAS